MRLDGSQNLTQTRPRTDLGIGLGIKPARKHAKSPLKASSKMHEPKTYDETINNLIHENR